VCKNQLNKKKNLFILGETGQPGLPGLKGPPGDSGACMYRENKGEKYFKHEHMFLYCSW